MATQVDAGREKLSGDHALELYRLMSKVHHSDQRVGKGLSSGEIAMSYWPVDGQEAMSAGAALGRRRNHSSEFRYCC